MLARLVANVCRRDMSAEEKTEMLGALGQFYIEQGVPRIDLVKQLVEKTGLSYRWVMKYIPNNLKLRPGLGGPRKIKMESENEVAHRATAADELFLEPHEKIASLVNYSNTNFATMLVEKRFFNRLREAASDLGVDLNTIINNALLLTYNRLNQLAYHKKTSVILCSAK